MTYSAAFVYPGHSHSANESGEDFGHPAHRGFQQSIGADSIVLPPTPNIPSPLFRDLWSGLTADIPQYDVYIFENAAALYAAPIIRRRYHDSTLIFLADTDMFGPSMHGLGRFDGIMSTLQYLNKEAYTKIINTIIPSLDGILSTSDLVDERIGSIAEIPSRVVYPYIQPDVKTSLDAVSPDYSSDDIVTIAEARPHKGIDVLVDAFSSIQNNQSKLHIVGKGHPQKYSKIPNVKLWGYVENLSDVLEQASCYIHPAQCEAFGVTVPEAMTAGLVPIVTSHTGARNIVKNLSRDLVVPSTSSALQSAIKRHYAMDSTEREELGQRARKLADEYNKKTQLEQFEQQYDNLLKNILPK